MRQVAKEVDGERPVGGGQDAIAKVDRRSRERQRR
jgi:hypothetical protein